jgi:hypothetical protein
MTKDEFEKVLEQKARASTETPPIDWEARKRDWLEKLNSFYLTVEGYLAQFQKSGKVKLEKVKVPLKEDHIGEYQADSMTIFLGSDKVTLVPVGTLLFGARGRVDMTGDGGTVKFILTGKNSNGIKISVTISGENRQPREALPPPVAPEEFVWKIATPPPKVRFIDLQEETFFSALTEVVNG